MARSVDARRAHHRSDDVESVILRLTRLVSDGELRGRIEWVRTGEVATFESTDRMVALLRAGAVGEVEPPHG